MFGVSEGGWTNALQLEAAAPQETLDMHAHVASEESCVTFHSRDLTTLALQQRLVNLLQISLISVARQDLTS